MKTESIAAPPCDWAGGNDILSCRTCWVEYPYRSIARPQCGLLARIKAMEAALARIAVLTGRDGRFPCIEAESLCRGTLEQAT